MEQNETKTERKDAQKARKNAQKSPDSGHRQRLRARFLKDYGQAMEDYELLELVLTLAIPRKDCKPLSKKLLSEFSNISGVLHADALVLRNIDGVGESVVAALKIVKSAAERMALQKIEGRNIISNWHEAIDYCRIAIAGESREIFLVIYLNRSNAVLRVDRAAEGDVDSVMASARDIAQRALQIGAGAVVLAHNHPSGDLHPSKSDVTHTQNIRDALEPLGIFAHDHIIVGASGYFSFKEEGLL